MVSIVGAMQSVLLYVLSKYYKRGNLNGKIFEQIDNLFVNGVINGIISIVIAGIVLIAINKLLNKFIKKKWPDNYVLQKN